MKGVLRGSRLQGGLIDQVQDIAGGGGGGPVDNPYRPPCLLAMYNLFSLLLDGGVALLKGHYRLL